VRFDQRKLRLLRFVGQQERCTLEVELVAARAKRGKTSKASGAGRAGAVELRRSLELPVSPCNDAVELVVWRVGGLLLAAPPVLAAPPAQAAPPAPPAQHVCCSAAPRGT
jgi:hypothetical protein